MSTAPVGVQGLRTALCPPIAPIANRWADRLGERHYPEDLDGLLDECAGLGRILSQLDPDEHQDAYPRERDRLAGSYSDHGHAPDAAWRAEEDLVHRLGLGMPPPKHPT